MQEFRTIMRFKSKYNSLASMHIQAQLVRVIGLLKTVVLRIKRINNKEKRDFIHTAIKIASRSCEKKMKQLYIITIIYIITNIYYSTIKYTYTSTPLPLYNVFFINLSCFSLYIIIKLLFSYSLKFHVFAFVLFQESVLDLVSYINNCRLHKLISIPLTTNIDRL